MFLHWPSAWGTRLVFSFSQFHMGGGVFFFYSEMSFGEFMLPTVLRTSPMNDVSIGRERKRGERETSLKKKIVPPLCSSNYPFLSQTRRAQESRKSWQFSEFRTKSPALSMGQTMGAGLNGFVP